MPSIHEDHGEPDEQTPSGWRCRGWVFTRNNPTEEDEHRVFNLAQVATYVVAGRETAPTTGTPHIQGFVYFDNQQRFSRLLDLLHEGTYIRPKSKRSTFKECSDYCKKDGDYFEHGELPMDNAEKGAAGKLSAEERWDLAKAGEFEQLPPEHYARYRAIYYEFLPVADRSELRNFWICGHSGCGKSRYVRDNYGPGTELGGPAGFYPKGMNKWWDGYRQEKIILLDDFEPKHAEFMSYFLKIWSDHYAFNAEIKGGMIKIRPEVILITSQYSIEECFPDVRTQQAISRRFQIIKLADLETNMYAPNFNH